jgi:predicted aspartyl protease
MPAANDTMSGPQPSSRQQNQGSGIMGHDTFFIRAMFGATFLATAGVLSAPALSACKLVKLGEVTLTLDRVPMVDVSLNGHPARLVVDTGSFRSLLLSSAVDAYGLNHVGGLKGDTSVCGVSGCSETQLVNVSEFRLAEYVIHDLRFLATPATQGSGAAGVLGLDFLSKMDVEFDIADKRLRLFHPDGCSGDQVVYWSNSYGVVGLIRTQDPHLFANVQLNGHDLRAVFDSGFTWSAVLPKVTQRPGLAPETVAQAGGSAGGLGGEQRVDTSYARFASLAIGQEVIQHPQLMLADYSAASRSATTGSLILHSVLDDVDMFVGADFFRAHRVYIARSQGKIYFTYSGGPIFGPAAASSPARESGTDSPAP